MPRGPEISITCEVGQKYAPFLRTHLRAAWRQAPRAPTRLSVAIVTTRTMSRLHSQFLGSRRATDVLSFELERDAKGRLSEGEIVICLQVARIEARRRGHPVESELLLYGLHGLLHLCGYVDTSPIQAARMHAREDQILESLGIGPVFAHRRRGRGAFAPRQAVAARRRPT